jgi:hypothetical protein
MHWLASAPGVGQGKAAICPRPPAPRAEGGLNVACPPARKKTRKGTPVRLARLSSPKRLAAAGPRPGTGHTARPCRALQNG